ncbi:MAG: hypothetical protein M3173_07715, partial [Chloroflexota bacterium]|nr:hypothetical protein [Chloroflexota bacterium]
MSVAIEPPHGVITTISTERVARRLRHRHRHGYQPSRPDRSVGQTQGPELAGVVEGIAYGHPENGFTGARLPPKLGAAGIPLK